MTRRGPRAHDRRATVLAASATLLAVAGGGPSRAGDDGWSIELQPVFVEVYGHDQHVLTIHEVDLDATPPTDAKTAVNLDTDSAIAYRTELRYARGPWRLGFDFFWLATSQGAPERQAAADGPAGPIDEVVFEVADRSFSSSDPSEVLLYRVLEDTDLEVWTADLYGMRRLAEAPDAGLHLQLGLRVADFDNDYRAVVGIRDIAGSRTDASSNYAAMLGPLLGLAGEVRHGRHVVEGYLGQSVVFGTADLATMSREFTGPFGDAPSFVSGESLEIERQVAIPITELRLDWSYEVGRHVALGLGLQTSAWWEVPVPPGVIPIEDGDEALHENTIVFFGALVSVKWTF